VVVTFADITVAKTLEAKLRGRQASLEKQVAAQDATRRRRKEEPEPRQLGGTAADD